METLDMRNRGRLVVFVLAALLSAAVLAIDFANAPEALATGGAFTSTKHGGGTVDGTSFPGVNRAINPDYLLYYNDQSADAGQYKSGECAHCHEPHSSFGAVEPAPNVALDAGPGNYLLFGDNANTFCWYCHESINLDPLYGGGTGVWKFYQGQFNFTGSSHGTSLSFRWPGDNSLVNPSSVWPRDRAAGAQLPPVNACINCHTPHGIAGGAYDTGVAPAAANYSVSTTTDTALIVRQTIAREEALCLNCHDGLPAATDIKAQVDKYLIAAGTGHPVRKSAYYGRHDLANESNGNLPSAGWFTAATAHAECVDCHNPHVASTGTVFQRSAQPWNINRYDGAGSSSSAVKIAPVNNGVWGLSVIASTGVATPVNNLSSTSGNRAYQLCLKCHSYWSWGAAAPWVGDNTSYSNSAIIAPSTDSTLAKAFTDASMMSNYPLTDVAGEFKTNNLSYHPVFATGRNTPERSLARNPSWCTPLAAATYSAVDNCAPAPGVRQDLVNLTEAVTYFDGTPATINLEQTLSQNFVPPWRHTSIITCVDCHEDSSDAATTPRGPHGSSRPFILRTVDTAITYTVCGAITPCAPTTATVNYANLAPLEQQIFCFNCHRADIYTANTSWTVAPTIYDIFARNPHPQDNATNAGLTNGDMFPGFVPRGISCLGCHGGGGVAGSPTTCTTANCKLGNIHGSNYNSAGDLGGNRLISPGGNWVSWTRGTTAAAGTCTSGGQFAVAGWSGCDQHAPGLIGNLGLAARYNYL